MFVMQFLGCVAMRETQDTYVAFGDSAYRIEFAGYRGPSWLPAVLRTELWRWVPCQKDSIPQTPREAELLDRKLWGQVCRMFCMAAEYLERLVFGGPAKWPGFEPGSLFERQFEDGVLSDRQGRTVKVEQSPQTATMKFVVERSVRGELEQIEIVVQPAMSANHWIG